MECKVIKHLSNNKNYFSNIINFTEENPRGYFLLKLFELKVCKSLALIIFCITITCFSCGKAGDRPCLKGRGTPVSEERPTGAFTKVVLDDRINLKIIPDSVDRALINAPSNLIQFIETHNSDGILTLSDKNTCNWLRRSDNGITVTLHCTDLKNLSCRGSGNVTTDGVLRQASLTLDLHDASGTFEINVDTDSLIVNQHNGPATVNVWGRSNYSRIYSAGNGFIYVQNLDSKRLIARHKGTGACHIRAVDYLHATVEYTGDIHVYGSPAEKFLINNGSGTFIQH